ncbi:MAG: hypothetical protein K2X77_05465 [Candidatus Obscuribacterales bacterium]|nr:hypothetical protein [Candidatus Obscuribacterales bacterium]
MNTSYAVFPGAKNEELREVGGKAKSLIDMTAQGMPVPPGLVLKVSYFAPWFEQLRKTSEWKTFENASGADMQEICTRLKEQVSGLRLDQNQLSLLGSALSQIPNAKLYAVRSSSPEEDLEGRSFAGAYETVLGVKRESLEAAIKTCFASCLDYAIFAYKQKHEMNPYDPKIAVVIQKQLHSDVAGVGFSVNPLTNDFDEAVITANFGLGESVVAGTATPDTFIVNKETRTIKSKVIGKKEMAVRLGEDGGTHEEQAPSNKMIGENKSADKNDIKPALNNRQVRKVSDLIKKVEDIIEKPVDIEWAFENEQLYLLQARPITAYQPLSPDMMTIPPARRRVYVDVTKCVQGIFDPLSVMATSFLRGLIRKLGKKLYGVDANNINSTLAYVSGGHLYLNLSTAFMFFGKKKVVHLLNILDPLTAKAVDSVSEKEYVSQNVGLFLAPLKLAGVLPTVAPKMIGSAHNPEQAYEDLSMHLNKYRTTLRELEKKNLPIPELYEKIAANLEDFVIKHLIPRFGISRIMIEQIKGLVGPEFKEEANLLNQSLPHNVTVEMGLALYDLAQLLPQGMTPTELAHGIVHRNLPEDFLAAWDKFIENYGHRGPKELDIASPRYENDPSFLVMQLISLRDIAPENSPRARHDRSVAERVAAYGKIRKALENTNSKKAKKFDEEYKIIVNLGGLRETPKFSVIYAMNILRKGLLKQSEQWVAEDRLDFAAQIFDMTLEDVTRGLKDRKLDLRKLAKDHLDLREKYKVATLPTVFDSRGRIIKTPPAPVKDNQLSGIPISTGSVRGKVKVLHSPHEKPLLPGEILVARATDPGWTPLFALAGGIILEVGGILQHGALVAREYGLPGVSGIENATEILKDGMTVEVNGTDGIITLDVKIQEHVAVS